MGQLSDALFNQTQQAVLGLLYGQPERSFYTKEILRRSGMGVATIKREMDRLLAAGILRMTKVGNQHHYQANPQCPIYGELIAIVKKTIGVAEVLRQANGYRTLTSKPGHHMTMIQTLDSTIGLDKQVIIAQDGLRKQRHQGDYSGAMILEECVAHAQDLQREVTNWLKANKPELMAK